VLLWYMKDSSSHIGLGRSLLVLGGCEVFVTQSLATVQSNVLAAGARCQVRYISMPPTLAAG
jgi:hypothetical protein